MCECEHVSVVCCQAAAVGCLEGCVKGVMGYAEAGEAGEDVGEGVDKGPC
jgi:hypothetical protein